MSEPETDLFARSAEPKRVPLWKLEEMAGEPSQPEGWRGNASPLLSGWETAPIHTSSSIRDVRPRRTPGPLRLFRAFGRMLAFMFKTAGVLAVVAFLAGVGMYLHGDLKPSTFLGGPATNPAPPFAVPNSVLPPAAAPPADAGGSAPHAVADFPTPGREEQPSPLGRPAPVPARSGVYAFLHAGDDGKPVTYDPCRPIHYVTRAANSPAAGPELIQAAVAAVSRATGLVFINDGATSEAPSAQHRSYQPTRYGDRWAPVLIAWETSAEEPRFTNKPVGTNIMGLGGSEAVSIGNSGYTYVSGQLELNGPALETMIGRNGPAQAQGVIEHELGHVVGLDHVQDPTQLMNPSDTAGVTTYQAGDLNGLAILGQGACRPGI